MYVLGRLECQTPSATPTRTSREALCVCILNVCIQTHVGITLLPALCLRASDFSLFTLADFWLSPEHFYFFFSGIDWLWKEEWLLVSPNTDDLLSNACLPINLSHSHSLARQTFLLLLCGLKEADCRVASNGSRLCLFCQDSAKFSSTGFEWT
jgi:hypothetical protein